MRRAELGRGVIAWRDSWQRCRTKASRFFFPFIVDWSSRELCFLNHRVSAMRYQHLAVAVLVVGGSAMTAVSDEGMYLLNNPPKKQLRQKYEFDLTEEWLTRAMLASVRLNSGGSG